MNLLQWCGLCGKLLFHLKVVVYGEVFVYEGTTNSTYARFYRLEKGEHFFVACADRVLSRVVVC
jgi:hypothetical protein